MTYTITAECIGCTVCKIICPVNAIQGEKKELHVIDEWACLECGACGRVCSRSCVLDHRGRKVLKLKKELWPKPYIDRALCYACESCVSSCPVGALSMADRYRPLNENFSVLSESKNCIACGFCISSCMFDAISMEERP